MEEGTVTHGNRAEYDFIPRKKGAKKRKGTSELAQHDNTKNRRGERDLLLRIVSSIKETQNKSPMYEKIVSKIKDDI